MYDYYSDSRFYQQTGRSKRLIVTDSKKNLPLHTEFTILHSTALIEIHDDTGKSLCSYAQADLHKVFANKIKPVQSCIDARGHHFQTPFIRAQRLPELALPCVTVYHHSSIGLYRILSAQRLPELPLLCVTVYHHSSTGLYRILSAQRHSERTVQRVNRPILNLQ
jgi:hypothetical protein